MAYFAQLNDDDIVVQVIAINNDTLGEPENMFPETEPIGQAYIAETLGLSGTWLQTSYNGSFRGTFAGIGFNYDATSDLFVAPPISIPDDLPPLV